MARLPDPVCEELEADWVKEYKKRENFLYKMVAVAIRDAIKEGNEKKKGDEKEDKD